MTQAETIRRLRAALAPFAGAWDGTKTRLSDTTHDAIRQEQAYLHTHPEHWKEASRVMRDTAHAERPQELRTRVHEQLATLNAMCESMLSRKSELDRMIAESRALIDTYKEEEK